MGQQSELVLHFVQWFGDANQLGIGVGGKTRSANSNAGTYRIVPAPHVIGAHYVAPGGFGFRLSDGVRVR